MDNNNYINALKAEWLKVKSTIALKLSIIYPLIPVCIYGILMFHFEEKISDSNSSTWLFFNTIVWNFWSSFALIPLIGIQTILINNLETSNNGWRNLFSLPFPRGYIYMAKLSISFFLILISLVCLSFLIFAYGVACSFLVPQFGFQNYSIPLDLLSKPLLVSIGTLGIICLHYFIGVFVKNIYTCFGIAVFVTILSLFLIQKDNIAIFSLWSWGALSSQISVEKLSFKSLLPLFLSMALFFAVLLTGILKDKSWNRS